MAILSISPQLVMVAGVNGAGKSTITARLRQRININFTGIVIISDA